MKYLSIFFVIAGCSPDIAKIPVDTLHEQAKSKSCTSDQLKLVRQQYEICTDTGYYDTHCMDMAIVGQCSINPTYKGTK